MIGRLSTRWRGEAALFRRRGLHQAAELVESLAEDLEAAMRESELAALTLTGAAAQSGYTIRHLKRLAREGKLPIRDDGTVLRRELPRKPGSSVASDLPEVASSRMQLARAVAEGG